MEGSPRLADFGLCSVTRNTDSVNASTPHRGCTVRYCAPELLDIEIGGVEKIKMTNKTDVYSLSMVAVEVRISRKRERPGSDCFRFQLATGKVPYAGVPDSTVILMVSRGKRPSKPRPFKAPGMSLAVWKIAQKCWNEKARDRPEVDTVLQSLQDIANTGGCTHKACSCSPWELIDSELE